MTEPRTPRLPLSRVVGATVGAAGIAAIALYRRNPSQRWNVQTEVRIAAPPEEVWRTLVDFASYPEWNPFLIKMDGVAQEGEALTGVTLLKNGRTYGFSSTFARAETSRHLSWGGGSRRMLSGLHWIDLEQADDGASTLVRHGEDWTGILIPLLKAFGIDEERYLAMNEALRIRTERRVAEA